MWGIIWLRPWYEMRSSLARGIQVLQTSLQPQFTVFESIASKQGRIVHRCGLNNDNNKNENKKISQNWKFKISYLTVQGWVKVDIFWVKEKNKVY